jgi:hypothetical protein
MARYVITFSLPAAPGAVRPAGLATRLDAALLGLRSAPVRTVTAAAERGFARQILVMQLIGVAPG